MLSQRLWIMTGVLSLLAVAISTMGESEEDVVGLVQPEIAFEVRVIEVMDTSWFKRLGLNISYYSAEGGNVIGEKDFGKVLKDLQVKDNPAVRLLAYGAGTTMSGEEAYVEATVDITHKYTETDVYSTPIGVYFRFKPSIASKSSMITMLIRTTYRRARRWREDLNGFRSPVVRSTSAQTALSCNSGDTIVLGGSAGSKFETKPIRGRVLFLITVRRQEVTFEKDLSEVPREAEKGTWQIEVEERVIEVRDKAWFSRLGVAVGYDSAGGGSVIEAKDLEKILKALQIKDNPSVQLLSYLSGTSRSGIETIVKDVVTLRQTTVEEGGIRREEPIEIGAYLTYHGALRFTNGSPILTMTVQPEYSRVLGWTELEVSKIRYRQPIISKTVVVAQFPVKSGQTIVMGASSHYDLEEYEDLEEYGNDGHVLFLITTKVRKVVQ